MGMRPPEAGQNVTIPTGRIVVLDQTTPVLNVLWINGTLIFDDSVPNTHHVLKVRVYDGSRV